MLDPFVPPHIPPSIIALHPPYKTPAIQDANHKAIAMSSHPDIVVRLPRAHAHVKHEDALSAISKQQSRKPRAIEATTRDGRPEIVVRLPPASAYSSKLENGDTPSVVAKSLLLELPRELRDMIYSYALLVNDSIMIRKSSGIPEPELLFVNKVVRSEAITIFYKNKFRCQVLNFDDAAIHLAVSKLKRTRARDSVRIEILKGMELDYNRNQRNWKNLVSWLHARQEHRSIGVERVEGASTDAEMTLVDALFKRLSTEPVMATPDLDALLAAMRPVLVQLHDDWAQN